MDFIAKIEDYLNESLCDSFQFKKIEDDCIPLFLYSKYDMYETVLQGKKCTLLLMKEKQILIKQILIHIQKLSELGYENVILSLNEISYEQKKRLLENKIGYIIPYHQLYIPYIYIKIDQTKSTHLQIESFSPSTQMIYIYLMNSDYCQININELKEKVGLSRMTINRALRELAYLNIISTTGNQTRKTYVRADKKACWDRGNAYLKSPVKKTVWVKSKDISQLFFSGDTALSHLTMMNDEIYTTYAVYKNNEDFDNGKVINEKDIVDYQDLCKVEIWNYDPALFVDENNNVDVISLYSCLKDSQDERIQIELDDLIDRIKEI